MEEYDNYLTERTRKFEERRNKWRQLKLMGKDEINKQKVKELIKRGNTILKTPIKHLLFQNNDIFHSFLNDCDKILYKTYHLTATDNCFFNDFVELYCLKLEVLKFLTK